ncbi:hypothetical protein [Sphingobium sp. EP60837]|uniref:hypothetical protein n=1 Tax=Sphingobium sp. EP60837 TaxID=1855519 RepID=UPI0009ECC669|nr:hypothetical protein [Sphingobium sp. EP60837]
MAMTPWLSVIIPVHMGAQFLPMTLASAAAEDPTGVEFRIYNSGDDNGAARRAAAPFFCRMNIIWEDVPDLLPWTSKTNKGVHDAGAPHVVMLHQDDLWLPGHLDAVRTALQSWPDAVMSIGASRFVAAEGRLLGHWRLPFAAGLHEGAALRDILLVQNNIAIPSPVIRREAWLAIGGMEEALWFTADWDLYLKIMKLGRVGVRNAVTTGFRIHGGSLTIKGSRDPAAFLGQFRVVLNNHADAFEQLSLANKNKVCASIAVNCALAAASCGDFSGLLPALIKVVKLGPVGAASYLHKSRILDRLRPRLDLARRLMKA